MGVPFFCPNPGVLISKAKHRLFLFFQVDGHHKTVCLQITNRAEALRKAKVFIPIVKTRV